MCFGLLKDLLEVLVSINGSFEVGSVPHAANLNGTFAPKFRIKYLEEIRPYRGYGNVHIQSATCDDSVMGSKGECSWVGVERMLISQATQKTRLIFGLHSQSGWSLRTDYFSS